MVPLMKVYHISYQYVNILFHDSTRRFTKIGVKQINDVKNTVHV